MIHEYSDAAIERIARGLIERTLPYGEWTHGAHYAAGLWFLRHADVLIRHGGMEPIIRRYNEAVGVPNSDTRGYHATITIASLRGAAACLAANRGAPLSGIHRELMASALGESRWPLAFWREKSLMGVAARRAWEEPDLAPLPYPPLAPDLVLA
jgi:hypothetical protein